MQQCKEMAAFLFQRMEDAAMNRKYKNSFNKDNIDRMFSEPNDTGSIRMLSIHPQMGIKMILECDSELAVIISSYRFVHLLSLLIIRLYYFREQFGSVAQSCPTLLDPMVCSMPGLPVHHQLPELIQTHVP